MFSQWLLTSTLRRQWRSSLETFAYSNCLRCMPCRLRWRDIKSAKTDETIALTALRIRINLNPGIKERSISNIQIWWGRDAFNQFYTCLKMMMSTSMMKIQKMMGQTLSSQMKMMKIKTQKLLRIFKKKRKKWRIKKWMGR